MTVLLEFLTAILEISIVITSNGIMQSVGFPVTAL